MDLQLMAELSRCGNISEQINLALSNMWTAIPSLRRSPCESRQEVAAPNRQTP